MSDGYHVDDEAEEFILKRDEICDEFVARHRISTSSCEKCLTTHFEQHSIRCYTCCQNICPICDLSFHSKSPFHHRVYSTGEKYRPLLPVEFYDSEWNQKSQGKENIYCLIVVKIYN